MREKLIEDMIKEVYGPRYGPEEEMDEEENVLKEYITGILIPSSYVGHSNDPDSESHDTVTDGTEDNDSDDDKAVPISSELNAKLRIKSAGISFNVPEGEASFRICITWGRYHKKDKMWKRTPYQFLSQIEINDTGKFFSIYKGDDGHIDLYMRKVSSGNNITSIIAIVINNLNIESDANNNKLTAASIFQLSIRVNRLDKNKGISLPVENNTEDLLNFLYRNKSARARGFMCSAVWKDIEYPESIQNFIWPDGLYFYGQDSAIYKEFKAPDFRTDFIPLYADPSPELNWDKKYGEEPVLSAYKLSEMWDIEQINRYLNPLVRGYKEWVDENRKVTDNINTDLTSELITRQEIFVRRVEDGINTLKINSDVRLAFCFSMRVLWLQYKWKNGTDNFKLRPFQLAFLLINLDPLNDSKSSYRDTLDLLWVPTGGGKTEAYLSVMAFDMALRRIKGIRRGETGGGTAIITRYTLRLLTIQQFARTMKMVTAAEYLRVLKSGNLTGWRPEKCDLKNDFLYGSMRFSAGIWVGGSMSPNSLDDAIKALTGKDEKNSGDPAQVIRCPACGSWLSIPPAGLPPGNNTLYFVFNYTEPTEKLHNIIQNINTKVDDSINIVSKSIINSNHNSNYFTLKISIHSSIKMKPQIVDWLWNQVINKKSGMKIASFRASRPGYFGLPKEVRGRESQNEEPTYYDFEIYCTNPSCALNNDVFHIEGVPPVNTGENILPDKFMEKKTEIEAFKEHSRIPVPAYTVDEQIYRKCPTILISTVDKIARLAFEPSASSIFGNIRYYNKYYGYYFNEHQFDKPSKSVMNSSIKIDRPFAPPELIVQDELHLLTGALGSMFGLYESAIEGLIEVNGDGTKPRYIASTATIKDANNQIKQLFNRGVSIFPPYGVDISDNFFSRRIENSLIWNEENPGRIYMGIYSPGMGPLTPLIRIWAQLIKTRNKNYNDKNLKYYQTIVGYFNAIRELGGGTSIYREDILERLATITNHEGTFDPNNTIELSSRINSTDIPPMLDELEKGIEKSPEDNPDAIFTTSMFGTGVDISHLSLMIVNGQPKTTSQYIQATGRTGRSHGGLIVTFLHAGKPRDLSHYEMFTTYHSRTYTEVEPPSVLPFAEGTLSRVLGPVMVSFLRNLYDANVEWYKKDGGCEIVKEEAINDIEKFKNIMVTRCKSITGIDISKCINCTVKKWKDVAGPIQNDSGKLMFVDYTMYRAPSKNVVLGDPAHAHNHDLHIVYHNAPQSLREVEETISFKVL
jgi:hypothetical protein